jgi:hypothetical protein
LKCYIQQPIFVISICFAIIAETVVSLKKKMVKKLIKFANFNWLMCNSDFRQGWYRFRQKEIENMFGKK